MIGPFCCIICRKVEEDLEHSIWSCEFAQVCLDLLVATFVVPDCKHRDYGGDDQGVPSSSSFLR